MGGVDQRKVGGSSAAAAADIGGTQPGVGKTTLVGAQPAGELDPLDDPSKVPPEFAALHSELVKLLWRSRGKLRFFTKDPNLKFWEAVRTIGYADLHTLVQIQKGTTPCGLWPMISELDNVYTYSTSWGIHFTSSSSPRGLTKNGEWGWDHPQALVASQHPGGTGYEWFRQNTGSGNPGLHLGVDIGAGHNDVHWDPTNPMARVGTGELEFESNPVSLFGIGPPVKMVVHPKGWAVYGTIDAIEHMAEVSGAIAPSANADKSKTFLEVGELEASRDHAANYANMEEGVPTANTRDPERARRVIAAVRAVNAKIPEIAAPMKALAMQDDTQSGPKLAELRAKAVETRKELVTALVALFQHMKAEAPGVDARGYDSEAAWKKHTHEAYDPTALALIGARTKKS